MASENLNTGSNVESTKGFNVRRALTALFATLSMQYGIAQQSSNQADTTQINKNKTEIVQQGEDPVKDLMKKYKVDTLTDVELLDLKDMIAMLKEVYYITNTDKKLELSFNELTKKLEGCIDGETRGFDFASLKPKISDEEKKLDQQLTQKTAQIENLNQSIKSTKADIDRTKQVISMLEGSKK